MSSLTFFLAFLGVALVWSAPASTIESPVYFFAFGDSYTTVFFDTKGALPSTANPIGNPAFSSATVNGGENWVKFLTATYNATLVLTYDLGVAGATIDQNLVDGATVDLFRQATLFKDNYAGHLSTTPWTADNSIFGFWFGINDINNGYNNPNISEIHQAEIKEYFAHAQDMYNVGARNFFFLEAPPLERFPALRGLTAAKKALEVSVKNHFNFLLQRQHEAFVSSNKDVKSILISLDSAFATVLDNPHKYGAPNNTCSNKDGVSCLWHDGLHAGVQIHNQIAQTVAAKARPKFFQEGFAR